MSTPVQTAQIADLLQQVENSISNIPGSNDSKYAALGRLKEARNLLEGGETRKKREPDAPQQPRQETLQPPIKLKKKKRNKKKGKEK
jgi:hypothetical protein